MGSLPQACVARVAPGGLLVFFPSYGALSSAVTAWKADGSWGRIAALKPLFEEPREAALFPPARAAFQAALDAPRSGGACFLAVCRGKASEGMNVRNIHTFLLFSNTMHTLSVL